MTWDNAAILSPTVTACSCLIGRAVKNSHKTPTMPQCPHQQSLHAAVCAVGPPRTDCTASVSALEAEGRGRVQSPGPFCGDQKVSTCARSPPCPEDHCAAAAQTGTRVFFTRGLSRSCGELLQVPHERSPRTCTAGTVALTPARCLLTKDNTTLLASTVAWRDRGESPSGT